MQQYELERLRRAQRVDRFVDLVNRVDVEDETFEITRDGKPVAVVLSKRSYDALVAAYTMQAAR